MTDPRLARSLRVGALLVLAWMPAPAFAQIPTPPPRVTSDVIVTATAAPAPTASVGRTVTVLTRAELEQMGIGSIIEALRLIAGVDPKARGGADVQTDF